MGMEMESEGKKAMKRLAQARAKKNVSQASKVGKRLDRLDMENAPIRPFLSKIKGAKPAPKKKSIIPRSPTN
jgi:hypothetical protein